MRSPEAVALYVSVPVASFRVPQAREYFETLPVPPPSTVYGMLLSLVGEEDRLRHVGAHVALALLQRPAKSVVVRTLWRVKTKKAGPGLGENRRPDFQELLTGLKLAVWVRSGETEVADPPLADRVSRALGGPATVARFGGLCLGESTHLVDVVRRLRPEDSAPGQLLERDPEGQLPLPVWVDHVGGAGTRWGQYSLVDGFVALTPSPQAWTAIMGPER